MPEGGKAPIWDCVHHVLPTTCTYKKMLAEGGADVQAILDDALFEYGIV